MCVWNTFTEKYKKGIFVVRKCLMSRGAWSRLHWMTCKKSIPQWLPMTTLTRRAPFLSLRSWRPKTCCTLWQSMQRTEKCLVSAVLKLFYVLVKVDVDLICLSWYYIYVSNMDSNILSPSRSLDLKRPYERRWGTKEVLADSYSRGLLPPTPHRSPRSKDWEPVAGCKYEYQTGW